MRRRNQAKRAGWFGWDGANDDKMPSVVGPAACFLRVNDAPDVADHRIKGRDDESIHCGCDAGIVARQRYRRSGVSQRNRRGAARKVARTGRHRSTGAPSEQRGVRRRSRRETLFALVTLASSCDLVVAYVPQASMGTALEMNAAYEKGVPVIAISPMRENWVIRALSARVFPDLPAFVAFLASLDRPSQLIDTSLS